ncbi:SDR family NAD(P)-dependent oxidoreductase [Pseudomonas sp. Irchel 3E19]|uniref:SDR family NAD(P)-dependent oxidoreductase n=1 Tax=Pseudomonas sp. Irchel 3E19 TaxID=2008981 RepID=UPI000BA2D91C|nr:SDR family NAD(P)-dependent oxidoreductase [Pseudomonas sp. Irchel 3E19]
MTVCITTTDILNLVKDGHISLVQGRDLLRLVAGNGQPVREQPAGAMDIAIIGMSGRFPGADSTSAFWDNLKAGRNSVAQIPASRWDSRDYFDPDRNARNKSYSKWAGLVDDIKGFDADFFNISPREALLMDPQQRLFFQEAWGAIEDAGYAPGSWSNSKCGVFVGCVTGDYLTHLRQQQMPADAYSLTGNASSILAARLSYFLNLKGPAVAVDTACSSSLVSVHMACESLQSGTCEVALAGGVMLYNTPELFVLASQLGMLSPDGLCKTFDERANGIVISEAVAVVVLKPLAAAERDGDTIHAVIRASGINQDGKTPGITVPSAYAQTQLLSDVHARAGIDPRSIGYVEAHGTGTRLGDPIEVEALTAAFRQRTEDKGFCAIGSVKTNIGHAQVAAGITSLIKAVLCLRHQTLPPSLHLEQPNQHIDFANSPFFTLDRLQPWTAQADHPRRACVSSLGFSGTNAHLVLEEYVPAAPAPARHCDAPGASVAVLSARTPERLKVMAERLLHWLDSNAPLPALRDVLHTLQSGRDPMPARLALLCDSLESLAQGVRGFLAEGADRQLVFVGDEADEQGRQAAQAELAALPQPMARDLARLWAAGAAVQWPLFSPQEHLRRVPLPTYAFAATPYWAAGTPVVPSEVAALHPIQLHRLNGTPQPSFSHRFESDEVYLKDHLVSGAPTLLGVSHLEMAVTAQRLAGEGVPDGLLQQVRNVAWIKPVIVTDQPQQVQVDLQETERGTAYRISDGAGQLFSQGRVGWVPAPQQMPRMDLAAIKSRCTEALPAADCYRIFVRNDLVYGPSLRALETLYFNASESLSRLVLPQALRHDLGAYTLHPSLVEGALQSMLGLLGDPSRDSTLYIPYSLNEITVYAPLTATCYGYARVAGNHGAAQFAEKRFDIDLLSDDGQVLVAIRSLSYRPYSLRKKDDLQLFAPHWQAQDLDSQPAQPLTAHTVLFRAAQGGWQALEQALSFKPWRVSPTPASDGSVHVSEDGKSLGIDPRNAGHWQQWLDALPASGDLNLLFLLEEGLQGEALLHLLYQLVPVLVARQRTQGRLLFVSRSAQAGHRALAGFARVLRHEHPGLWAGVLEVSGTEADAARQVEQELRHGPVAGQVLVRYQQQVRQVQRLEGLERSAALVPQGLFRQGGVYLISGGAGALGLQIARQLRRRFAARVMLCGRSPADRVAQALAQAEEPSLPGLTRYLQADVSRQADVEALHRAIKAEFGVLNGVLHAAGAIRDSLIVKQDPSALGPVIEPKVAGVRHLDEVTRGDELDLFLVFSSISSLAGTVGQSAYAYANEYLDHFAQWRDEQVRAGQRQGKSLSVNWPYWRDGGMRLSEQNQTLMRNVMGVQPLSLDTGMEVLLGLSTTSPTSLCVAVGDRAKIEKVLGMTPLQPTPSMAVRPPAIAASEGLVRALGKLAADILRRDAGSLRPQVALTDYGFDSITYVELANRINRDYALDITPALFYEHKTLEAVAQFLALEQASATPAVPVIDAAPVTSDAGADLMATLKDLAAQVLHKTASGFNVDSELGSYGFDSITYVELANKLNGHYDIDITPALFYEHKTLAALGGFISAQYPQTVAAPAPAAVPAAVPEPEPAVASAAAGSAMPHADNGVMPIAIIGMAGVLPGSPDLERFWEHQLAGDDMITTVPAQRWSWEAIYGDPAEGGKTRAKWGGFIDDVDKFDSLYFNISPHEAKLMDPSQRLILETVFSAIGNAGYASSDFAGSQTSVFIGVCATDYLNLLVESGAPISAYSSSGLSHSMLANRISYQLGCHGPSEPVDTACSSSLVALHRAVESIRNGCEMAIAGGVNLLLSPYLTLSFSDAGMLSEDGRCKTFSEKANGYVRSEGAGAVLLKPLHQAIADGDVIHAVIHATAENHGGRASSPTAPNPVAQSMLLVDAYTRAGIDPSTITYIETHGTGTPLGDPIEINGLKDAFATLSRNQGVNIPQGRCGLGAVKTHIGHLEAAAGMAGLFKVILSMQHRTLPGNLHFDRQNPYIKLADSPFYIVDQRQPWTVLTDAQGRPIPRRAGVSSLGFAGANAHVVLEEYVAPAGTPHEDNEHLVVLSARTRERLLESVRRLARHLEKQPQISLANLAYTLQVGRDALAERLALVVGSVAELAQRLREASDGAASADGVYWSSPDSTSAESPGQQWDQALATRDLKALAQLWTRHREQALDWRALSRPAGVRRVALPSYPFARIRHWAIDEPPVPTPPAPEPSPRHTLLTFAEHWQPALAEVASAAPEQPRLVLCCLSDPAHQAQLRQQAATQMPGSRLVFLSRQGHAGANSFALDPQRVHELNEVLGTVIQRHGAIDGLLYLWPLETPELSRQPGLLVSLVQALSRLQQNVQRVLLGGICRDGADRCQLESWIGLERSMPRILSHTVWQTVLLESTAACDFALAGQGRASACFEPLLTQWRGGAGGSSLYVGHQRHQLSMQRLALEVDEAAQPAALPSARANTWLITGGSGHLGLLFADHLARTQGTALRLALVGRSAPTPALEQRLQALAGSGAQVRYWQADVTDFATMEQVLIQARTAFGPLQGFIHAAGVEEGDRLLQASAQAFQAVLAPKVAGSEILDALTAGDPLVHACYFSSTAALLGDMGAGSYAMGNRFLMAHATYRNQRVARGERHGQTIAINWPLWKDGGMGPVRAAADSEQGRDLASYLHRSGQALLTAQQGLAAFEAILRSGLEHAAVACGDASRLAQLFDLDTPAQPAVAPVAAALPSSAPIDLHTQVLSELQGLCSDVAQIPATELPGDATLSSFGFDSINLARLAKKMQQRFGFAVSPALFFSHPTLERLAGHLAQQHGAPLAEHYRSQAAPSAPAAQAPQPSSVPLGRLPAPVQAPGNQAASTRPAEPMAIIGASGRFPQCDSVDEMWQLLLDGRSAVSTAQAAEGYSCGSLRGVDEFDPLFFGISPRAAQEMDPRQRLLLEESWRALEDAGVGPRQLASQRVGVFVGLEEGEYFQLGGGGSITANHSAIAASHLAYFLDLDGPVMALNTACSSGLVALHQACQSLRLGECEMALVSSANLMLMRQSFTRMDEAGMLSPDGRCHTFDQRANGMVPGEAVVALVVKPLSKALADGDPIVSVIAASAINYDGKTNGITAPNGAAQARLLASTYEACELAPGQIDYLVTHGTGTALGDAVEVNALAQVFGQSQEGAHCALTSTKTNFGHCLAASGLVSTLCLASALRHETIPPSLNFETHNDFVDWQASGCFVNTAPRPWPVKADGPRHGAVSAFGMSGTNAHAVLRDLAPGERRQPQRFQASPAYLLVLSARSILSLCDRVEQLIEVLVGNPQLELAAVSHSLLDGRHHFEYRCALVVEDQASALDLLRQLASEYLPQARARAASDDAFPAQVFQERVLLGKGDKRQAPQPSIVRTIEQWVRLLGDDLDATPQVEGYEETLRGLAEFYCQGYALPWHLRYPRQAPVRLQLPTYPFEHGHYWVDPQGPGRGRQAPAPAVRPLVRHQTSQANGEHFVSAFSGQEFFLADHVVQGHHVLPGVAYLEMALQAATALHPHWRSARIAKVGWMAPLIWDAERSRQVETRLTPLEGGFAYRIASRLADQPESEPLVHGQGVVTLFDTALAEDCDVLDIQALKARSRHVLSGADCYAAFQAAGLAYGPACRVIEAVYRDARQCLVRLVLPEAPGSQPASAWTLHAALLDGALQGVAGFFLGADGRGSLPPKVPFALERIDIHGRLDASLWALLSLDEQGAVSKVDARLYDDQGQLRVSLRGLAARDIALGAGEAPAPIRLLRQWQTVAEADAVPAVNGEHQLLLLAAGDPAPALSGLRRLFPQARVQALAVACTGQDNLALARDYQAAAEALFAHLQGCLGAGASQQPLFVQVVLLGWPAAPAMLGLDGLLKTASLENPRLRGQLIATPTLEALERQPIDGGHATVWLDGGQQRVPVWTDGGALAAQRPVWKDAGCYLITGGAGALGRLFARDIIEHSRDARIVLVGRSLLSPAEHQQLAALERRGARVEYCQADIGQLAEVEALLASVQQAHGPLSGVIHNAGLIADDFIVNKTLAQFARVLEPKVRGTANLDHATRNMALDYFVLGASASGVTGNVGQADYAAANAFLDGFAQVRNRQVARGERHGHSLSMDWSLWAEGRMRPDASTEERLWSRSGIRPLSTAVALAALRGALAAGATQVLVAEGDRSRALASLDLHEKPRTRDEQPQAVSASTPAAAPNAEQVQQYFKQLLCDVFALPAHRIDARAPLEDYGIDSIMVGRLTARLEEVFGPLSKTLFFEFQTLEKLCGYFLDQHGPELARRLAPAAEATAPLAPMTAPTVTATVAPEQPATVAEGPMEFAIVGLSGQYPLAADLQQFWSNLREGRDCITPIPAGRWNHERFYNEQKNIPGTTYGKWGGFIEDLDCFDTLFFNVSAREAELLDPQERLFLQCAYHLLEDAGYTRASLAATARRHSREHSAAQRLDSAAVGVFVGAMYNEYQLYGPEETVLGHPLAIPGNIASIANRVSYFCNLHGPSVTLDTMCSSSLTAIHMACQSLLAGDCALAIAGGVNVTVHPNKYLVLGQGRFLSDDGRCRSFGEGGSGYVPGEGVGAVLIRPLADALAQGDRIYGVIQASSINHGGKTNGFSVPNPNAQAALIEAALQRGRVDPRTISYIEAHGTGTALGDPIEIAGLGKALGAGPRECAIGSVKSNIGHCESAAGIAGLTKILLQFQHRQLVPSLHSAVLNGKIGFAGTPFRVQQTLADWQVATGEARVAAVSSFGAGGSNAHLILREPTAQESATATEHDNGHARAIPLSARTAGQLRDKLEQLRLALADGSPRTLADIAHTLQEGREAMRERLVFMADSLETLATRLQTLSLNWAQVEAASAEGLWRDPAGAGVFFRARAGAAPAEVAAGADLEARLRAWVEGAALDWAELRPDRLGRRIGLPLYPFAKERYWAPLGRDALAPALPAVADQPILARTWHAAPLQQPDAPVAQGGLLILCTERTHALAQGLFASGGQGLDTHYLVHQGQGALDFHDPDTTLAAYRRCPGPLTGLIDLTALDAGYEAGTALERGKLALLQAFVAEQRQHAPRLLLVSHGLHPWQIQPTLQGARTAGLYRMLNAEYRGVRAGVLDTDLNAAQQSALIAQIEAEFNAGAQADCCYRQGQRFVPAFEPIATTETTAPAYCADDVLLVTGGTGGIGAALVDHLVQGGVRAIAIIGREPLPDAGQWPRLLADKAAVDDRVVARVRRLQAWVEQGVRLAYQACSLESQEAVEQAVDLIEERLGPVTGVFHCAGSVSASPAFIKKSLAEMAAVCAPKITGLAALYQRLDSQRLRFFLMFSSVSASVPTLAAGQSDYAMANAYMDQFALAHRRAGLCSVQWPAWAEVGMAVGNGGPLAVQLGLKPLDTAVGLGLLDRVLALALSPANPGVCLPCHVEVERFSPARLSERPAVTPAAKTPAAPAPVAAASLLAAVEATMRQLLMEELKFSAEQLTDRDMAFADYGIESIMVLQLMESLSAWVGNRLDPSLMFEFTTLGSLCEHLASTYSEALAQHLGLQDQGAEPAPLEQSAPATLEPVAAAEPARPAEIAIIGLAVRLPGAADTQAFWALQSSGESAIGPMREHRWPGGHGQAQGGWLDGIDRFDPAFFGLNPKDAAVMDPQARLMLEQGVTALFDAGYSLRELSARPVGVYIGGRLRVTADARSLAEASNPILGVGQNYLASNLSRFCNLTGPSMVVDTACSSGLTAMSLAFDALRSGSIDMALVGATSLLTSSDAHDLFSARNILSPDGAFNIFDDRAAGDVLGEGVVALVCKNLAAAQADGDRIYCVVKGLAVNNDGRTLGPGSPSLKAQQEVMRQALAQAGKTPRDVGYIEVNGGGSVVVDAVEIKALAQVYQLNDSALDACCLGSVKPSVGHLLLSSGLAGFARCALSLQQRQIVPSACGLAPFEHFDFAASRVHFNRRTLDWKTPDGRPRVAAQSCFPDGGTNCHVILEEFIADAGYVQVRQPLPAPLFDRRSFARHGDHAPAPVAQVEPAAMAAAVAPSSIPSSWGVIHEQVL